MMNAKWIRNNLTYWDTHQCRLLDAWGPTVVKLIEDFVKIPTTDGVTTLGGYTVTDVTAGAGDTLAGGTGVGGELVITTAATENDGYSIQANGEAFKLTAALPCYFGIRFKIGDATETDFIVGLCITDTDLLAGMTDGVYFVKVDGSTAVTFVLEKNSTPTASATIHTMTTSYVTLEFYFDGTNVDSFVNGVKQTRLAMTNLCQDEELTPSIEFLTGEGNSNVMTVDWMRVIQFN
jgi:hypothetical protein